MDHVLEHKRNAAGQVGDRNFKVGVADERECPMTCYVTYEFSAGRVPILFLLPRGTKDARARLLREWRSKVLVRA
jgi:hypothetical protein